MAEDFNAAEEIEKINGYMLDQLKKIQPPRELVLASLVMMSDKRGRTAPRMKVRVRTTPMWIAKSHKIHVGQYIPFLMRDGEYVRNMGWDEELLPGQEIAYQTLQPGG